MGRKKIEFDSEVEARRLILREQIASDKLDSKQETNKNADVGLLKLSEENEWALQYLYCLISSDAYQSYDKAYRVNDDSRLTEIKKCFPLIDEAYSQFWSYRTLNHIYLTSKSESRNEIEEGLLLDGKRRRLQAFMCNFSFDHDFRYEIKAQVIDDISSISSFTEEDSFSSPRLILNLPVLSNPDYLLELVKLHVKSIYDSGIENDIHDALAKHKTRINTRESLLLVLKELDVLRLYNYVSEHHTRHVWREVAFLIEKLVTGQTQPHSKYFLTGKWQPKEFNNVSFTNTLMKRKARADILTKTIGTSGFPCYSV
jgi:hypothetical protein